MDKGKVIQCVVRSYRRGYTNTTEYLERKLSDGYNVVMAHPFVMADGQTEYIEYILQKYEGIDNG